MANNPVTQTLERVAEETVTAARREATVVGEEFRTQLLGGLYGTTNLTNKQMQKMRRADQTESAAGISAIRSEIDLHAGQTPRPESDPRAGQTPQPFKNLSQQQTQRRQGQIAHAEAQRLGAESPNAEEQERRRREQLETEEEERKKTEEQKRLDTPIEAPQGRTTGLVFKRRRTGSRMQPPKSAESKHGRGIGG